MLLLIALINKILKLESNRKASYSRQRKDMTFIQITEYYQYIVKIFMTIDFKYSWKHFQEYCKELDIIFFRAIAEVLKHLKIRSHLTEVIKLAKLIWGCQRQT